jgi:peptidoglycan/LPS O-acetylase OafA/YrhL
MKKTVIIFIVAALVLVTTGLWFFTSRSAFKPVDLVMYSVIITVVGFALFVGYKRLTSVKNGEPAEDELSKKVLKKTAAFSYYISLYLWLAVMYAANKTDYETHVYILAGILGMAVIYAICWLIFNFRGVRNE